MATDCINGHDYDVGPLIDGIRMLRCPNCGDRRPMAYRHHATELILGQQCGAEDKDPPRTQQLAAKSPGAGKLLVALTREQVSHLLDLLDEQVIPDRPCGDCVPIIAILQEAYGQQG
jgi:hypothetical protein